MNLTEDTLSALAHIIQTDISVEHSNKEVEINIDSSPQINTPWGIIYTDIEILDYKEKDGTALVLSSIKGDLGFLYSYSNITETSNFAIIDLGSLDNLEFEDSTTILQDFMRLQPHFKKTWTRDNSEETWKKMC